MYSRLIAMVAAVAILCPALASATSAMLPNMKYATTTPFETNLLLGDKVTVGDGPLRERKEPTVGSDILGVQQVGAQGRLMDGPALQDGHVWWFVDYESGPDGWSAEEFLRPVPLASSRAAQVAALQQALESLLEQVRALQQAQ